MDPYDAIMNGICGFKGPCLDYSEVPDVVPPPYKSPSTQLTPAKGNTAKTNTKQQAHNRFAMAPLPEEDADSFFPNELTAPPAGLVAYYDAVASTQRDPA